MTLDVDVSARFEADGTEAFAIAADLSVEEGETLVVLGPSGSGKTLLLETVAGFHGHRGSVTLDGRDLTDEPPERRDFGFVFQDYALFPHMTVRENVAFGGRYRDATEPAVLLDELGVTHLADRRPPTLSGGEAQRVALARSLAVHPSVLLLDEPLSSLDVPTRQSLRDDLVDILADVTAVYVTHNRTTARAIADRIAVMRDGEVIQVGTPDDIFTAPASPFVATFTGSNCVALDDVPGLRDAVTANGATHLAVRPEHVTLDGAGGDFQASVARVTREDAVFRVTLAAGDATFDAYTADPPAPEDEVGVHLPRDRVTLLGT